MPDELRILLVSSDLMSSSRIVGLARSVGAEVETLAHLDAAPHSGPFAIVLVDLQALTGDAAAIVGRARTMLESLPAQAGIPAKIVAFGPHVHRQRLDAATAAGADAAISRGELLGSFADLVGRWMT